MKLKILFFILTLLISLTVFAQSNPDQADAAKSKFQVRLFEVKHKTPSTLAEAVMALGSGASGTRIDPNNNLKTITVRDYPENIAAIEGAIKRLDIPDPAPVSIQTQIYLLAASEENTDTGSFPKELEPVLTQLKATLKYKGYRFLNTFVNRVNDGGSFESSGTGDLKLPNSGNNPTFLTYQMSQVRLATDNAGKEAIRVGKFHFGARVPVQINSGQFQYQDVGIYTELSLSEGGIAVVGTTNLGTSDGAAIVVVSAKKVK